MSGEHTHPDLDGLLKALVADVSRLTAQVVALEADAATGGARPARAFKDYVEVKDRRDPFPVDGDWHPLPGLRPLKGSPFRAPNETQDLYARLYPKFTRGGELSIEVRYVRSNGDPTAYDEILVTQAAASVPITRDHNEVGSKGIGGEWQLKLTGDGITCEVGTRYQKLRATDVDWIV